MHLFSKWSTFHLLQTIAIIPEVILRVHVLEVQVGVLAPQNDLVPQHHLVEGVLLRGVLGRQVQEQLLHVPVEQRVQIGAEIERDEAEIVLLPRSAEIWHIFAASARAIVLITWLSCMSTRGRGGGERSRHWGGFG